MASEVITTDHDKARTPLGFGSALSFEYTQRAARALAASTLVPETYRHWVLNKKTREMEENHNAISNCIIALNMSHRLGADPLMIMQNLYIVEGRPSWSAQFMIACVNQCGRFSPLRYELSEPGEEREVSYERSFWANGVRKTETVKVRLRDRTCRAWVIEKATGERLDGPTVSMEMAVREGWFGKNGSKWQTMDEIMLRYRSASFFARLYAPELTMGLQTDDEVRDMIDVPSEPVQSIAAPPPPSRADYAHMADEGDGDPGNGGDPSNEGATGDGGPVDEGQGGEGDQGDGEGDPAGDQVDPETGEVQQQASLGLDGRSPEAARFTAMAIAVPKKKGANNLPVDDWPAWVAALKAAGQLCRKRGDVIRLRDLHKAAMENLFRRDPQMATQVVEYLSDREDVLPE